jgi:hypothetical protein
VSRITRMAVILAAAIACVLAMSGAADAALKHHGRATCGNGATLRSGSYASVHVTGFCTLSDNAYVVVRGNMVVGHHGAFNAITHGHITVRGDMRVRRGGVVGFGCAPSAGCDVTTTDRVNGDVIARGAKSMIFHGSKVLGNFVTNGGGGGVNCNNDPVTQGPDYTTFEDGRIGGNFVIKNVRSCWFGFFRTHVKGSVIVKNNHWADPDAGEIQTNVIRGDLICRGNNPAPQQGDSGGSPNKVFGREVGQCRGL